MSGVEINDVQFCQISYQLDRSITTVAEDFEALFLEWHGSDPAIDHSAYRITLFGTQAEMNDYVEIIDLDSAALVNLSLMTPITAETAFSTPTQLFAGLPVQSHTHLGGMSLYHLDMPFGRIAAETQLHSYLKQSGWKREQMSVSEQRYIRGDATAVLETADQSDSITLIIIQP
ncbi:MAG: hypothetical protein KGY57_03215 [Gammaproteobacteria bacterium]|nr:hypothetical protein [Gammaproteobacteria bacterium]